MQGQAKQNTENKQRAFVALLLALGTLIVFGVLFFQGSGKGLPRMTAGTTQQNDRGSIRP